MKLNRRDFLKALAAVGAGAGAVLAGVGGTAEAEKTSLGALYSQTGHLSLDRVDTARHELLSEAHPDLCVILADGQEYFIPLHRDIAIAWSKEFDKAMSSCLEGANA